MAGRGASGSSGLGASGSAGLGVAGGPVAGMGAAAMAGVGGTSGMQGASGVGGVAGSPAAGSSAAEPGRLAGITAAHNAVRARQMDPVPNPALPPMTWSNDLAMIAKAYADKLAADDCAFEHSMRPGVGENLAFYGGTMATPMQVTEAWAGEEQCYTFGPFMNGDACDMQCTMAQSSNGCGHYTQIVWRGSTELGCGIGECAGSPHREIWVCNYRAQGNIVGRPAY